MQTKVFIKGYNPYSVTKHFSNLDYYFRNMDKRIDIFSPEGIFSIENKKMVKLVPKDNPVLEQSFETYDLLLDTSYFEKELVLSQIPYDHISTSITRFYYGSTNNNKHVNNNKLFLQLIIEGTYETTILNIEKENKYKNFVPTNIYFLLNESFDNILVKKELSVFLSILK
jgi:hypothetical protein